MHILAIESSCDESAVALLKSTNGNSHILAQELFSQINEHQNFGGIVPEIAARAHLQILPQLIPRVLKNQPPPDAIAATCGPGLIGGLIIGATIARAIALARQKPFLAVNHLAAHALSPRLVNSDIKFPYLLLLVSGGHCQTLAVRAHNNFKLYGQTLDDAPGEALDKAARLLNLGWPGGANLETCAEQFQNHPQNHPQDHSQALNQLPIPLAKHTTLNFSFSGLKTALARHPDIKNASPTRKTTQALAFAFQERVMQSLALGAERALRRFQNEHQVQGPLLAAGGVAANTRLSQLLTNVAKQHNTHFQALPKELCTDNAAMVAHAAAERLHAEYKIFAPSNPIKGDGFHTPLRPRWPLTQSPATKGCVRVM
ncbi:MAG: tRNA (adenosine(37)-N6)-threonylcarbamoyltransferase complex transferase subunit TsaD [Alphaproteobacteria bacterium]